MQKVKTTTTHSEAYHGEIVEDQRQNFKRSQRKMNIIVDL